jgi:c-di-GMP-binding flagellar brake protein YcgR
MMKNEILHGKKCDKDESCLTYMFSSRLAAPLVFMIFMLLVAPETSSCAPFPTGVPSPSVATDAQQQFMSGMNTVFSGREQNRFGWGRSAIQIALIFGAGMVVAIIVGLLVLLVRTYRHRDEERVESETLFLESSLRCGLTEEEREKLVGLLSHQRVMASHTIFQSLPLFEQCMDAEVSALLRSGRAAPDGSEEQLLSELRRKLGFSHLPLEHPLVSTRNITIGQTGSLFGKEGNRPLFNRVSVSDNNSFFFTIQYNVEKEDVFRISPGTPVRFIFARQHDGLYGVQVRVARVKDAGAIDLLHTMDLRRNQLRQYVRIETNLPMRFRLLSTKDPDKSEIPRGHLITTRMSDISGGGLSFLSEQSLRLNDLISLNFDLPGVSFAGITGKIVHLTLREGKNGALVKHHVQFVNIEPRRREQVVKYVFEKERQLSQWR